MRWERSGTHSHLRGQYRCGAISVSRNAAIVNSQGREPLEHMSGVVRAPTGRQDFFRPLGLDGVWVTITRGSRPAIDVRPFGTSANELVLG